MALIMRRMYSSAAYRKVTHCIFDLDGLILDTEIIYKQMISKIAKKYGKEYTTEVMLKLLGTTEQRTAEIACKEMQLPIMPQEFRSQFQLLGDEMLGNAPMLKGAKRLLEHLHKSKVPFAMATSSSERSVITKTENYPDLVKLFNHKVMGSTDPEVKFGKPHPDIFLVAASRFADRPDPAKCLVFEDAPNGVTAAREAGMQAVMVPDHTLDKSLTKHATVVLPSLQEFKPEIFGLPPFKD